ncbi:MAG: hypothetical protein COB02_14080 [Candidatus Cloacimonadota bacterium]|nr:MAG: hypothetical protein COB02_14080 [Candidatus Cloacimonadota bacterium]
MELGQIEPKTIQLNRNTLLEKRIDLLDDLKEEEAKKKNNYIVVLVLFVFVSMIDNKEAMLTAVGFVGLIGAGVYAYDPASMLEVKKELEEINEYLRLFEERDAQQALEKKENSQD